jgi:hypothetical protein
MHCGAEVTESSTNKQHHQRYAYEAYEAKKKGEKLRCLLLRRKKENIIILFMM